jgi:hypothetical protein
MQPRELILSEIKETQEVFAKIYADASLISAIVKITNISNCENN